MHPEFGIILPENFIGLAEETGLILPIGRWVLESACKQIKIWEADSRASKLSISVNVSALQFHQPDFVENLRVILKNTGINTAKLKLELTESVVLKNINETIDKMNNLKSLGVSFAIDDFGTGYSSLSYLTKLPLDQLKIDQSFVHNIGKRSTDAAIVQTIIGMANNLGIHVIAEGVETEAQRSFLRKAGCMAYQGFLFSEPMPVKEFGKAVLTEEIFHARIKPEQSLH